MRILESRITPPEIWQPFIEQQAMEGEAAVVDAPAVTNVGEAFSAELSRLKTGGTEPAQAAPAAKQPTPAAEPEPAAPVKATPKSAMDAALGGEPVTEAETKPPVEDDPLKEFGDAPKPGHWKQAKEKIGKLDAELRELRAKKSEADPLVTEKLTTLETRLKEREAAFAERERELAEYKDAMAALNVELDPQFRREFIDGRKKLVEGAAAKIKNYGGNPEALADALAMPEGKRRDAAIEEALEPLETDTAKDKVRRYVSEIEALDERRAEKMGNPQQAYEELERKTVAQRQKDAEAAEQLKEAEFERITRDLHKSAPTLGPVDETLEGGKDWNAAIRQAREDARKLFSPDATFPDMVTTAVKGKDYDRVAKLLASAHKEAATLRAQLAQYEGAQPDIRGTKAPAKDSKQATGDPGQMFAKAMATLSASQED